MECRAGIGAGDIGEVRRSWGSNMFKQLGKTASTVMLAAGIAVTAGAAPATVTLAAEMTAFDQTTIEQDLAAVDLSVYTENSDGRHALLDDVGFMEYAYSSDSTVAADYFGLYFYVYNPTAREISTRAGANVVNMAVSYDADGEPTEYANCAVTVLDYTDDHLIYKFKLTNSSGAYDRAKAYASAHDGVRRYDIAGIQLWFSGDANATDSNAATEERGITYRCTGYGRGCGADKDAASTLQIDEDAGSIFIPVEWNCTEPGEAYADVELSFEAWSEEGYYLGSDSLDPRNLSIEQTQEGIFLDLTGSWEGLRQAIDQLLTGGYGDIPFRYEIRMWITVTLHHEYLNFEGLYSAEGDEIIHAHITFEGPWIIW